MVWKYCSKEDTHLEYGDFNMAKLYIGCYGMKRLHKYIDELIVMSRRNLFTNCKTDTHVTGMEGLNIKAILDW